MRFQDISQLRPLEDLETRFKVRFRLHGGLPHRLLLAEAKSQPLDLFESSSLLGDIDLVHTGKQELTASIIEALFEVVPTAECFRWQVRSSGEEDIFEEAKKFNAVIPALRISVTKEGLEDPEGGANDIKSGRYRYRRNSLYRESPLHQSGRDLELVSALLYMRLLASSELDVPMLADQPGFNEAAQVIAEAANPHTFALLKSSAWLRARIHYIAHSIRASAASEGAIDFLRERVFWDRFAQNAASQGIQMPPLRPPQIGTAAVITARLHGEVYRLPDTSERWLAPEEARGEFDRVLAENGREPLHLAPGQEVVLASPPFEIQPGVSGSSHLTAQLVQELAHFDLRLKADSVDNDGRLRAASGRCYDASNLGILAQLRYGRRERTEVYGLPSAITIRRETSGPRAVRVGLRVNCWAVFEAAAGDDLLARLLRMLWLSLYSRLRRTRITVQFFAVGWSGQA